MTHFKSQLRKLQLKRIKRTIEWVLFGLLDKAILTGCKTRADSAVIAIVHNKLLGDYILWSPYGRALAQHAKAQGKKVVLVVNSVVQPLAQQHFPSCTIIGIDRIRFVRSLSTRMKFLRLLRKTGAHITYHDTYPRDAIIEDAIVHALGAPAWGFDATFADRPWLDYWLSRRLYVRLLPPMDGMHQSQHHRSFLQAAGVPEAYLQKYNFAAGLDMQKTPPYFVISPGASRNEKRWQTSHFITVAQRLLLEYPSWRCVVLGTQSERMLGEEIVTALGIKVENRAGDTNLIDFVRWIAHAQLVLGNDSAACHIAAACGVASFPIVGGGHIGQFFPYDPTEAHVSNLPVAIFEQMSCFGCNWICHHTPSKHKPFPCITAIKPDRVWKEIRKTLPPVETHVTNGEIYATHPIDS